MSQYQETLDFFNDIARRWHERAYDPEETFVRFPTSRVRQDVTIEELKKRGIAGPVLDIGCGTGQLVIDLHKIGVEAYGIDNAPAMIEEARRMCAEAVPEKSPSAFFEATDFDSYTPTTTFRGVTAMGFLEYLPHDAPFFNKLFDLMAPGAVAYIECRSKLFNLFSGNEYTKKILDTGEMTSLLASFSSVARFSPMGMEVMGDLQEGVLQHMQELVVRGDGERRPPVDEETLKTIPSTIVRRQHTPEEIEVIARSSGLSLQYVVYYHAHPFPPVFAAHFPVLYNKMAFAMQPLGYTPLGVALCSSFVAVLQKT